MTRAQRKLLADLAQATEGSAALDLRIDRLNPLGFLGAVPDLAYTRELGAARMLIQERDGGDYGLDDECAWVGPVIAWLHTPDGTPRTIALATCLAALTRRWRPQVVGFRRAA
jgi:hypothetical protein